MNKVKVVNEEPIAHGSSLLNIAVIKVKGMVRGRRACSGAELISLQRRITVLLHCLLFTAILSMSTDWFSL